MIGVLLPANLNKSFVFSDTLFIVWFTRCLRHLPSKLGKLSHPVRIQLIQRDRPVTDLIVMGRFLIQL